MSHPDLTVVPDDDVDPVDYQDENVTDDPFLPVGDDVDPSGPPRYFDGDTGTLDLPARKALQALLKWTFISARRYPAEWRAFVANRVDITSRLNDLLLEVVVDTERQVAFKRQAVADGPGKFTTLLYDSRWSREETVLLVHVRTLMRAAAASGQTRAFVDRDDMLEHLALMRPTTATNASADRNAGLRAIAALNTAGVLEGRKDDLRFEIDRVIEILLPLDRLEELLAWITKDAGESADTVPDADDSQTSTEDGSTLL